MQLQSTICGMGVCARLRANKYQWPKLEVSEKTASKSQSDKLQGL